MPSSTMIRSIYIELPNAQRCGFDLAFLKFYGRAGIMKNLARPGSFAENFAVDHEVMADAVMAEFEKQKATS